MLEHDASHMEWYQVVIDDSLDLQTHQDWLFLVHPHVDDESEVGVLLQYFLELRLYDADHACLISEDRDCAAGHFLETDYST